jgi:hypothetical protein
MLNHLKAASEKNMRKALHPTNGVGSFIKSTPLKVAGQFHLNLPAIYLLLVGWVDFTGPFFSIPEPP